MRVRRGFAVTAVVACVFDPGCGSTDSPPGLAAVCTLNSDCVAPYVCSSGRCHAACANDRDCSPGTLCVKSKDGTICQLTPEVDCTSDAECNGLLVCANDGKCRNACQTAADCVAPQVCATGGFCAKSTEVDPQSNRLPNAPGRDASVSSGGRSGSGGAASGGASATGGAASGGTSATGGATESGGTTSTGGAGGNPSSGGTPSTGGSPATGGTGTGGAPRDSGSDAPIKVTLTVQNPLGWCTIGVGAGAPSVATQVVVVTKGTVVQLTANPSNVAFLWGYWTGTDGAADGGKDTSSSTTVTMDGDKTVSACCPRTVDPTSPCP